MFHEVNSHVAKFAKHTCQIDVCIGTSVAGPPVLFVAEAFVRETGGAELRPVVWRVGDAVAIHGDTEGRAVSGILRVLEHHLGPLEQLVSASVFSDPRGFKGDPRAAPRARRRVDQGHFSRMRLLARP